MNTNINNNSNNDDDDDDDDNDDDKQQQRQHYNMLYLYGHKWVLLCKSIMCLTYKFFFE